jgi:hypothetical protein
MSIALNLTLDKLVDTFTRGVAASANHLTPEHAGLAAVIEQLTNEARYAIARNLDRYDHRSLYEFAAALDYATKPPES